jgi:muramoyltetrapeptide carboxypeptidase
MITPPKLVSGDCIGIVSTARKIQTDELVPFLELLEKWDLNYVLGDSIDASSNQFAGDTELRIRDFQQMLNNPEIKAIWCARGGYGTVQIIDHLDFSVFIKNPKWIIGYSDITVLHSHIHNFGIETLHANMAIEIDTKSEETRSSIKNVLFGIPHSISIASEENNLNKNGKARGSLVGGNLSVLYSIIGSPSAINTEGKILFIEDLDEMVYHIDRMMQNLKRNGLLEHLSGLIVGGMSEMRDNTIPYGKTAEEIISEVVNDYDFPVCFNFPTGHIQDNRALIMGRNIEFIVDSQQVKVTFNAS